MRARFQERSDSVLQLIILITAGVRGVMIVPREQAALWGMERSPLRFGDQNRGGSNEEGLSKDHQEDHQSISGPSNQDIKQRTFLHPVHWEKKEIKDSCHCLYLPDWYITAPGAFTGTQMEQNLCQLLSGTTVVLVIKKKKISEVCFVCIPWSRDIRRSCCPSKANQGLSGRRVF